MRKKSGLTQVQLGIKLNFANNTIGQYEKGRRRTVSVKPVVCIVNVKAAISENKNLKLAIRLIMKRTTAIILASIILMFAFSGCTSNQTGKTANDTITSDLYFTKQEIRRSPDWVTKLDAAKECEQLIVVAGVDKTTAYVTMHEKNNNGEWEQIIATPGFIGLDGLGKANINDCYTPVGTFTIDKAFGLADNPGCQITNSR